MDRSLHQERDDEVLPGSRAHAPVARQPTRPPAGGPWAAGQGSGAGRRHGPVPLVSGGRCGNRLLHQTGKRPLGTHRWPDAPGRPVARSTGLGAVGGCRAPLGLE